MESPKKRAKPSYGINLFHSRKSISNVLIIPGMPNFGIQKNNGLIKFFNSSGSNVIFLNDKSQGEKLEEIGNKVIGRIKKGELKGIEPELPLFVVGLSFGGGISLKLADNEDIKHTFALSPLTQDTEFDIDWEGLSNFIKKQSANQTYKTVEEFKEKVIAAVTVDNIEQDNISIFGIDNDEEISIPEHYKPTILSEENLGIRHFGLSKLGSVNEKSKREIFDIIISFNQARDIEKFFIETCLQIFGKENVHGIMTHGTKAFDLKENENGDFDFILVLEKNKAKNSRKVRKIQEMLRKKCPKAHLDISLFVKENIEKLGFDYTVTSTHGPVYSMIFGYAKTLYGENIFEDSLKHFNEAQIRRSFVLEIGKYVDRFNRIHTQGKIELKGLQKYLARIIMCYMIGNKKLGIKQSNYFTKENAIQGIQRNLLDFKYAKLFIKVLESDTINQKDIDSSIDGLNLFLNQYGNLDMFANLNSGRLQGILRNLAKMTGYKSLVYVPEKVEKPEEVVGISCLGFEELNVLSKNMVLTEDQMTKNMVMSILMRKLVKGVESKYGVYMDTSLKIGDFGIELQGDVENNIKTIKLQQSFLEKELKYFLVEGGNVGKLSEDFMEPGDKRFKPYEEPVADYESFLELLKNKKYRLSAEFVQKYINKYFDKDMNMIHDENLSKIIYSSIKEHLELGYRIATKWENKVVLFMGNQEKVFLISEVMKSMKENTNILIGLSNENK